MKIPIELESLGIIESQLVSCVSGGNSQVYKVYINEDQYRAYKLYKGDIERVSKMYLREKSALDFLKANGITGIPKNNEFFPQFCINSYDWIDGISPAHNLKTLQAIFGMLSQLNTLSKFNYEFETAVDYVFNVEDLLKQFPGRISRLTNFPNQYSFLQQLKERIHTFELVYGKNVFVFSKTLSLSDVGVHNMISNGISHTFIDFEFFGYDSTAKMIGDLLLHPRNRFLSHDVKILYKKVMDTPDLDLELKFIMPLLSLKWSLISASQITKFKVGESNLDFDIEQVESRTNNYLKYFDYSLEETGDLMSYHEFEELVSKNPL